MNRLHHLGAALCGALALLSGCGGDAVPEVPSQPSPAQLERPAARTIDRHLDLTGLPAEATPIITQILRGGPFAYRQDGTVFHNREHRLPAKPTGYYREYTVPAPGERTRGPRRIVAGGQPPAVFYYTADHYRSFKRIPERR